jgi:hypothetical protein
VPDDWHPEQRAGRLVSGVDDVGVEDLAGALVIVEPARSRVHAVRDDDRP